MSHNISISIKNKQYDSFREFYDKDKIEEAAEEFKQEVIDKRDEIHEEVNND